jgi:hypothetical protein
MAMTPALNNTLLVPQGDYSPVVRDRINRLIREADRLFSIGNIRKRCQQAMIAFFDGKQPSQFANWGTQLYEDREFRFALSLSLTYKSTMDEMLQWSKGCIDEYLLVEIQEERARWIEEFARIKFACRWYQMKDDDVAWRVFSKNVPYGEAGKEEEIKQFFETLDRICILTDVLAGYAEEYGLELDCSKLHQKEENEGQDSPKLVTKLKSIFYNNEENVKLFLKEISGMQPNDITDLVNRWVQEKRISDYGSSRKGDLWKILHEAKLYPRTIQNWNRRVQ